MPFVKRGKERGERGRRARRRRRRGGSDGLSRGGARISHSNLYSGGEKDKTLTPSITRAITLLSEGEIND